MRDLALPVARHDLLRDLIFGVASNASLRPSKEERHLLPGSAARPGDVLIRRWSDGKDALEKAYDRKMRDTADACRQQGLVFLPMALETLGGMHQVAVNQLKRLRAAPARHNGTDEREAVSQLFQRISLHLMRGNAALLTGRRPDSDYLAAELDGIE